MNKLTLLVLTLSFLIVAPGLSQAQSRRTTRKTYKPYVTPPADIDTRWAAAHSPWDFSGLVGIYNPGFGVGVRGAYRFLDNIINDVDDSMSLEAGLGFIGASNTYGGVNSSYSLIEIPIHARWDFRLRNTNFIVGPEAGFNIVAGSNVTVNGQSYSTSSTFNIDIGGFGMYRITDSWAARVDLNTGSYFALTFGATYFL